MTYARVLPRDLFNEANLLKCYGRLWLLTEGNPNAGFREGTVPAFDIIQDQSSGALTVSNLRFEAWGHEIGLHRPLNSKEPWPLYATRPDGEELAVFEDNGDLTPDMITLLENWS